MARRQKGPTTEELLEKLEKRFNEYQEEISKELETIKTDHEVTIQQLKSDHEQELTILKDDIQKFKSDHVDSISQLKKENSSEVDKIRVEFVGLLDGLKVDIEANNAESEQNAKAANDNILIQFEETKADVENLKEKVGVSINEIIKQMNDDSTELSANHDIFKDEVDQRLLEINQHFESQHEELSNMMRISDGRREEYFQDFKDELRSLNLKIEEVLDSVGITIQEKLKETNLTIQSKMDSESQEAQSHRAEIEFDVSGLKEKIEAMDQGLCELNEKIHEFEQNKRNNLIFYGLNNDSKETPELLLSKVQSIVKVTLGIRREIPIPKVTRMYNGKTFAQLFSVKCQFVSENNLFSI